METHLKINFQLRLKPQMRVCCKNKINNLSNSPTMSKADYCDN